MKILVDISRQDYIYITKKHCLPSCDDRTLRKNFYEMVAKGTPLDKIRAEIHATAEMHEDGDYYLRDEWIDEIFDKCNAESEEV